MHHIQPVHVLVFTIIILGWKANPSLRADEIKLWLTPSVKQRRNPCSGLPAVYPDLSTHYDWPVKKAFVLFVVIANQIEGKFESHFRYIVESVRGPEQGSLRCFADGTNQSLVIVCTQASKSLQYLVFSCWLF